MMETMIMYSFYLFDLLLLFDIILLIEIPFGIPMKSSPKQMGILAVVFLVSRFIMELVFGPKKALFALCEYIFYAVAVMILAKKKRFKALLLTIPAVMVYIQWGTNFQLIEALLGWDQYVLYVDSVPITPLYYFIEISLFVVLILLKVFTDKKAIPVTLTLWEGIILVLFSFCGFYSVDVLKMLDETFEDRMLNIAWVIFVLLLNGALIYAIAYRKRAKYYQSLSDNYKQQFDAEYAYFKDYKKSNAEISKFRHDWNNHMILLQGLLDEGKTEEAKAYFESLPVNGNGGMRKVLTGNETLDMILAAKHERMNEKEIAFTFEGNLQGISYMKPVDVCILFSNLIDNAMEAVEQCKDDKQIHMKATESAEYCMIVIKNSLSKAVKKTGDSFMSTKEDGVNHGIGIGNVQEILHKYSGEIEFVADSKEFTVKLLLPMEKRKLS